MARERTGHHLIIAIELAALAGALAGGCASPPAGDPPAAAAALVAELPPGACGREGSGLPLLLVEASGKVSDAAKVTGHLRVAECIDGQAQARVQLETPVALKQRGSSSATADKKSYALETRMARAKRDRPLPLLGMAAGSDWVLHGCYFDKTCLRNFLGYRLARELGRWSPDARFAEMYFNGRYKGLYLVVEKIKVAPQRVAMPAPAAARGEGDLTGGYIVRREANGRKEGRDFVTSGGMVWSYHYPSATKVTAEQKAYLRDLFSRFEKMMAGPSWNHPVKGYAPWLDVESWVDFALMQELSNNVDGYWRSMYVQKAPDAAGGRLAMGPVWDFDLGFGNADFRNGWMTEGWAYAADHLKGNRNANLVPHFWERLWCDPGFTAKVARRWAELRAGRYSDRAVDELLAGQQTAITRARERDEELYATIGSRGWPSWYHGETYEEEVTWLRQWVKKRMHWMDAHVARPQCSVQPVYDSRPSPSPLQVAAAGSPRRGDLLVRGRRTATAARRP